MRGGGTALGFTFGEVFAFLVAAMPGTHSRHHARCQNCGEPLAGPFCSLCGQHDVDYSRSFWHVLEEALEGVVHFDGKFMKSVRFIFLKPGFLTSEFNAGRRVRYAHPIRFYFFASFLFFGIGALVSRHPEAPAAAKPPAAGSVAKSGSTPEAAPRAKEWSLGGVHVDVNAKRPANTDGWFSLSASDGTGSRPVDQRELASEFLHLVPEMLFFCVPVLALVLKAAYFRLHRPYVEHLICALHLQAFAFLFLLVIRGAAFLAGLAGSAASLVTGTALTLVMVGLVYRALRSVYGEGGVTTAVKLVLVGTAYALVLLVGMLGVALASAAAASAA